MIRRSMAVVAIVAATIPSFSAVAVADPLETASCVVTAIKHGEDPGFKCLYPDP